jgi:hypothetical protein
MPMPLMWGAGLAGFLLIVVAWRLMRRHAWGAELAAASGIAVWAITVWHAWRTYHSMEAGTAAALGVLMLVMLLVIGRWVDRYRRA